MILRGTDIHYGKVNVAVNANGKKSDICGIYGQIICLMRCLDHAGSWFTGIRRETGDLTLYSR